MYMVVNGKTIKWKAKASIYLKIVIYIQDTYLRVWKKAMEDMSIGMAMFMKEDGKMI